MVATFLTRVRLAVAAGKGKWEEFILFVGRRTYRPRTVAVLEYEVRPAARYGWGCPPHSRLLDLLRSREEESEGTIEAITSVSDDLLSIPGGRGSSGDLSWDNDWWGGLDAMVLYAALRDRNPQKYVEVGSGYSTRFARRAVSDHSLRTQIVSLDPRPRTDVDDLCDTVIRSPLEQADLSVFTGLGAGDIVVMDGSHTAFMNSDAVVFFLDVLPSLAPGVLVGIDDIFLPWDYPPSWTGRWYGEQYLLASMLLADEPGWTLRFPAWYLTQESANQSRFESLWRHIDPVHGRYAMSFWMQKTS
ncbi:MAG TPA: class I SAM-dependent methyltransferase [Acidimicrobiales bacterium]